MGFGLALARQVFIVFSRLSLLFCPLLYLANERQVHNHTSKALVMTSTTFSALFAAAALYFIAKHERETVFPIVYGVVTMASGSTYRYSPSSMSLSRPVWR
jgi:ABC-type Fe3+-siderophore transport system permease subunit